MPLFGTRRRASHSDQLPAPPPGRLRQQASSDSRRATSADLALTFSEALVTQDIKSSNVLIFGNCEAKVPQHPPAFAHSGACTGRHSSESGGAQGPKGAPAQRRRGRELAWNGRAARCGTEPGRTPPPGEGGEGAGEEAKRRGRGGGLCSEMQTGHRRAEARRTRKEGHQQGREGETREGEGRAVARVGS